MRKEKCDVCGYEGIHEYQGGKTIQNAEITTEAKGYICAECYAKKHNLK